MFHFEINHASNPFTVISEKPLTVSLLFRIFILSVPLSSLPSRIFQSQSQWNWRMLVNINKNDSFWPHSSEHKSLIRAFPTLLLLVSVNTTNEWHPTTKAVGSNAGRLSLKKWTFILRTPVARVEAFNLMKNQILNKKKK